MMSDKPFCDLSTGEFLGAHLMEDFFEAQDVGRTSCYWRIFAFKGNGLATYYGLFNELSWPIPVKIYVGLFWILRTPHACPLYKFEYPCEWPASHLGSIARDNRPLSIIIDYNGSVLITAHGAVYQWSTAWILWRLPSLFD
jgi:hypothetical protein